MIEDILSLIKSNEYNLYKFSLVCSENALKSRWEKDINSGLRERATLEKALFRLNILQKSETLGMKIDVGGITPDQAANSIYDYIYG